jgi:hypothetical protein
LPSTWGDQKGFNARLTYTGLNFALTLRDGTVLTFAPNAGSTYKFGISQTQDANTRAVSFTPVGNTILMRDSLSQRALEATVDATTNQITMIRLLGSNAVADSTWLYGYSADKLVKVCRPESAAPVIATCPATVYTYDGGGRLNGLTRPKGNVVMAVGYDVDGLVATRTDSGATTTFKYEKFDADGRILLTGGSVDEYRTTTTLPLLPGTTAAQRVRIDSYDSQRRLVRTLNPGQVNAERRAYDDAGFLAWVENEMAQRTTFRNDSRGNVRKVWDPLGRITNIEYTAFGLPDLPTKKTYPSGQYEQWTYGPSRNVATARNVFGVVTTLSYYTTNTYNLLWKVSNPSVGTVEYLYNTNRTLRSRPALAGSELRTHTISLAGRKR